MTLPFFGRRLGLTGKLVLVVTVVATVPLLISTALNLYSAMSQLSAESFKQLELVRDTRKGSLEAYFAQIRAQAQTLAHDRMTIDAMRSMSAAFHDLPTELRLSPQDIAAYRSDVASYYGNEFGREFESRTGVRPPTNNLLPTDAETIVAQRLYIAGNLNPLGDKHQLDAAGDGSTYSELHKTYHPILREYLEKFGYYDIFLVDAKTGHIVYTVFKEIDYGTNLLRGPFKDSNIGEAFRAALNSGDPQAAELVDLAPYLPSYNGAASFVASPVYDGTELLGVLMFQMPIGRINEIVRDPSGLGEGGESFLIGRDSLMRSRSRFSEKDDALVTRAAGQGVEAAIRGETGFGPAVGRNGEEVLAAYAPVAIPGLSWGLVAQLPRSEATAATGGLLRMALLVIVVSIAVAVGIAVVVGRVIASPIRRCSKIATRIAEGMFDNDLSTNSHDEIGELLRALDAMQSGLREHIADQATIERIGQVQQALDHVTANVMVADVDNNIVYMNKTVLGLFRDAEPEIKKVLPTFDAGKLMGANIDQFHKNPMHQRRLLSDLTSTFTSKLQLGSRIFTIIANPVVDANGKRLGTVVEWADKTEQLAMETTIQSIVEETSRVCGAIAKGNLTEKIDGRYEGAFRTLKTDLNATVEKLTEIVTEINDTARTVTASAAEISAGTLNLSERTEQQASSLEETSASMEEMTSTVQQNAENAKHANQLAMTARQQAENGGEVVGLAVRAMKDINDASKRIADIIGVIDDIAFQTNLLALNASVEAARAGEQGRGFAVVASEVRNLAGRSATAAKEIKGLIEDSVVKVNDGSELVNRSGQTLAEIVASVKKVTDIVAEISAASTEQAAGIDQVNKAIMQMDGVTQQNAALVEETAGASDSMRDQALRLATLVSFFTTHETQEDGGSEPETVAAPRPEVERRAATRPWADKKGAVGKPAKARAAAPRSLPATGSRVATAGAKAQEEPDWEEF